MNFYVYMFTKKKKKSIFILWDINLGFITKYFAMQKIDILQFMAHDFLVKSDSYRCQ